MSNQDFSNDDVCARVKWVIDARFRGSQTALAKKLECSQSLLSRFVRGVQSPGRKLLDAILQQDPMINRRWLVEGVGAPLKKAEDSIEGVLIPVASQLLKKPPKKCPELLTEEFIRVYSKASFESLYWWRVAGAARLGVRGFGIQDGDLLLIETNHKLMPPDESLFEALAVVVQPKRGKIPLRPDPASQEVLGIGELAYDAGDPCTPSGLRVRFGIAPDAISQPCYRREPNGDLKYIGEVDGKRKPSVGMLDPEHFVDRQEILGLVIELRRQWTWFMPPSGS